MEILISKLLELKPHSELQFCKCVQSSKNIMNPKLTHSYLENDSRYITPGRFRKISKRI